jgi:glyoxylase-like metal-dependent hydrolase (beta-lactamase superfamily II)
MIDSISKIKKYDYDVMIYPGHGESTTLGYEISNNMYFLDISLL